jgi:hypothetical protein
VKLGFFAQGLVEADHLLDDHGLQLGGYSHLGAACQLEQPKKQQQKRAYGAGVKGQGHFRISLDCVPQPLEAGLHRSTIGPPTGDVSGRADRFFIRDERLFTGVRTPRKI